MVDRPRPADPEWLAEVEATFGECHLVVMTPAGERGIACQMQIEPDSLPYLRRFPGEKTAAIQTALKPLLEHPPQSIFSLRWDEEAWALCSRFAPLAELPLEIAQRLPEKAQDNASRGTWQTQVDVLQMIFGMAEGDLDEQREELALCEAMIAEIEADLATGQC